MKKTLLFLGLSIVTGLVFGQLDAGEDVTICKGEVVQLDASGGSNYLWTSIPNDPTLSDPDIPNPTVQPDTTTMYIVQSREVGANMLLNGSFELGNVDFTSEYIYDPASIWDPGTYAVVSDAGDVHPNFFCSSDHTSGNGLMMCVNGASTPNVEVWTTELQNIDANAEYEFGTWVSSLSPISPAVLQFRINDELLGSPFNASFLPCSWNQFFEEWESGDTTKATISIINQNTASNGNDFSLDDISFAEVFYYYDTVMVYVIDPPTSTFQVPAEVCSADTALIQYTGNGGDTSTYHWDFDGATIVSGSGPGPYELQWDTPGTKEISLWVEHACSSDTTLLTIEVHQSPSAGITADATSIPFGAFTFLHGEMFGNPGPLDYSWSPASELVNPDDLDPQTVNLEVSTWYTFMVIDESSLCSAEDSILIEVTGGALGITSLEALPDTICAGDATDLVLTVNGGSGNYVATWTSEPPGFTHSGPEMTLTVNPDQNTTYKVTVNDGFNTTPESTVPVVVNNQIAVLQQPEDTLLPPGETAIFEVQSSQTKSYQWQVSTDGGNVWTDLADDAVYSGCTTSQLTINPADETMNGWLFRCLLTGDCDPVNSDEALLTVVVAPNVINELEDIDVCYQEEIEVPYEVSNFIQMVDLKLSLQFDGTKLSFQGLSDIHESLTDGVVYNGSGNEISIDWNNAQATTLPDGLAFNLVFEPLTSDSSTVIWNAGDCSMTNVFGYSPAMDFTDAEIRINPLAAAADAVYAVPDSVSIMDAVEIELTAEGGSGKQFLWMTGSCGGDEIGEGTSLSIDRPEETTHYYGLWQNECGHSSCEKVTVFVSQEYDVYAPGAFSPNNDGLNDEFTLISPTDLSEYRLQVFDRWGQMLFESTNLSEGWDGTSHGKVSPPGTYVWKAAYRLRREGTGSDSRSKSGTVVLVR
jgi:gliding motility-associated-like protein